MRGSPNPSIDLLLCPRADFDQIGGPDKVVLRGGRLEVGNPAVATFDQITGAGNVGFWGTAEGGGLSMGTPSVATFNQVEGDFKVVGWIVV